ncbi:hypothetical protein [Herbaspirillum sp. ST 5-3]|uniref:hypothetical protein n=1 Tax=Oxalobacteraceae TaxID=75682 RepID=UPI0010A5276E|nr:hypothetical protein [Herbaspirillum sp. ST 5-3]
MKRDEIFAAAEQAGLIYRQGSSVFPAIKENVDTGAELVKFAELVRADLLVALQEVRALAEKWNKDAIDTGFAMSDPAYELFEVLDAEHHRPATAAVNQGPKAYCRACQEAGMSHCGNFDECDGATCITCDRPLNSPAAMGAGDQAIHQARGCVAQAAQKLETAHHWTQCRASHESILPVIAEAHDFLVCASKLMPRYGKPANVVALRPTAKGATGHNE